MKKKRGGSKPIHGEALQYWPVLLTSSQLAVLSRKAEELKASKSAAARAALKKGLPLITAADVLEESYSRGRPGSGR